MGQAIDPCIYSKQNNNPRINDNNKIDNYPNNNLLADV